MRTFFFSLPAVGAFGATLTAFGGSVPLFVFVLCSVIAATGGGRRLGLAAAGLSFLGLLMIWITSESGLGALDAAHLVLCAVACLLVGGLVGDLRDARDVAITSLLLNEQMQLEDRRTEAALQSQ